MTLHIREENPLQPPENSRSEVFSFLFYYGSERATRWMSYSLDEVRHLRHRLKLLRSCSMRMIVRTRPTDRRRCPFADRKPMTSQD